MPQYLYKIVSVKNWQASQEQSHVRLSEEDREFIHFAREDQLERIAAKYWEDIPTFVILKVDVEKLAGEIILEANPGGTNKYFHLYNGAIPVDAVVESRIVEK